MQRATPLRLALSACLLFALTSTHALAKGCKPTIDKKNVMVELQIEGFNSNRKLVFVLPIKAKKGITGSGVGTIPAQRGTSAANFSYTVDIAEERDGGAVVELTVTAT